MTISPVICSRIVSTAVRQAWRLLFGIGLLALCAGTASAAIAVDQTVSKDQGTSSKTVATAAFSTTAGNELLLAFISTDGSSKANTTVSSIAGGGLTWALVRRTNTQLGTSEIWRAFAPAVLTNVTVTATLSVSTASSMTVMSFTGTDTTGTGGSGAIGATGTGNSAKGAPTASLATTRNNSLVIGVGNDWDNAISRTPGTGQTVVHQYLSPAADTYWVQRQNSTTPTSGTTVTINDTAPSTDRYNLTIAEILAPATAAPTITATLGTPQSAMVTATFATALQATVKDSSGNLLSGASVTFTAPATTGPSGTFGGSATATVSTGTNGVATAPAFTADTLAGSYTVTATTSGATSPASFSLTNTAGPPMSVAATAGTSQSATIKTAFTTALQATVKDANNNPVSGASVIFVAPATGASGTFSNGTATITVATAATGVASAPFTANAVAGGPYSVTATVSGLTPVSFSLTNNPGPAASITATAGASQSTMIGSAFTTALQATVTDGSSNPIVGASVIFTAPATGASGTFSNGTATITVLTVTGGVATAAFTANTVAGGPYTVTAKTGTLTAANFSLTNNPGPAMNIAATAGGSQSATVNTAFTTALQAKVTDASNNPLSGVQVTFTAPGSGASGTFSNGTATITVATVATGVASAPFTANGTPGGPYLVTASAAGVTGSVSFSLTNNSAPPAAIAATAGTPQNIMIGTAFTNSLQATVTDAGNNPVVGASVTFTAPATGASGTFSNGTATISVATDVNGMATEAFTANTVAGGPYTVTAKTGTLTAANFSLTNNPGPAMNIAVTAGGSQSATVNTAFATSLQAKVTDASNNPLSGVQVTFTAPSTGASGTFSNGTATITVATVATGVASAPFTANGTPGGPYLVTASAAGVTGSVSFSLTDNALPPANIAATAGTPQNILIGTAFTNSLQATVTDAGNNPVVGVQVTFTAPATGASGTFSSGTATISVATDTNGMATEAFTANTVAGGPYTVTAGVSGVATPASFSLTNNPGPASNIAAAGASQSTTINTAFATALQAKVTDASNNPLSGVQVTFTAPSSGASGTFSSGTATITIATGTNGEASATFTANATAGGPYTVTASASGVTPTASFSLTNNAPAALAIDVTTSTDAATAKTTVVTPSFSTKSASELLLAFVSTDQISSPNTTVTGVTGGGLTWVMVYRTNVQNGDAEIWRAFAPSTLSGVTVTATLSQSVVSSITVVSFTGADATGTNGSGAIGATGSGNSAKGAPTASLVTTRNGSWVFGVANDFDNATARTLGTGQTLVHQDLAPSGDTYWVQRQTNTTPTSGSTVTINDTAPTADDFNLSLVEVLPGTILAPTPDLTITKSHSGNFSQGQTGATYTITVTNSGGAATSGTVSVTDSLPASLTPTAISGINWNCTLATLTCTRSDTLSAATSYPAITLTVNVASNAPGSVTNTATVSGGGETNTSNDTANDVTSIIGPPDLTITKSHTGNLVLGQPAAMYTMIVTNSGGSSTSGAVSVTDAIPTGLTATAMSGTGWACTLATLTCTRSDALTAGTSYPSIALTVSVASNAPSSVTNSVTVSGGGETNTSNDTANDLTNIVAAGTLVHVGGAAAAPVVVNNAYSFVYTPVGVNDAVVVLAGCRSPNVTGEVLSAPGWTFTPISGLVGPSTNLDYISTFGAIVPNTTPVTFKLTLSGGDGSCTNNDTTIMVDEFSGNDTTGGTTTFDAHNESLYPNPSVNCSGAPVTPVNNNDAIWYACFDNVTGVGGGYVVGQNDMTGDWSEYQILSGGAGVPQNPSFTTSTCCLGFGLGGVSIKPAAGGSGSTYTLSGTITPATGATVTLTASGFTTQTTTANASTGNYSFSGLSNNTYTVTPSESGFTFNPSSQQNVLVNGNSVSGVNFTSSGTISVAISPKRGGIAINQTLPVSAIVTNDVGAAGVMWSASGPACSGASCGTFTNVTTTSATYVAPPAGGIYSITATSIADGVTSASNSIGVTDLTGVLTYHNDLSRDGANTQEYALTTSNVNTSTFGKLFSCPVDGAIYAQPLWIPNVAISLVPHNIVVVATEHDSLYAFDADATSCTTLWQVSLINSQHGGTSNETSVPWTLVGTAGDLSPEIGVTGTPVIDSTNKIVYVVSKSSNPSKTVFQRLHAIDLTTGNEVVTPQNISNAISVPGTGDGSVNGQVAFNTLTENQRSGLVLSNGVVYVSWASHEDNDPFHGWVIGFNASTLAPVPNAIFNSTPNKVGTLSYSRGGVWMGGGAPAVDSTGNLFLITGNGTFDANTGGSNYGDSVVKLSTVNGLSVLDYFTPLDQSTLDANDTDFGSGAATILVDQPNGPVTHLVIGGGKEGNLFLINRDTGNMGEFSTTPPGNPVNQVVQTFNVGHPIFATPAFWQNNLYVAGVGPLVQYTFNTTTGFFSGAPYSQSSSNYPFPGATPSLSSNGATNGIVWALDNSQYCTNQSPGCGPSVLHAYNATNLATDLWNSSQAAGSRDIAGDAVKFTVPTVANGKVYVGTRGNNGSIAGELDVYGLLPN